MTRGELGAAVALALAASVLGSGCAMLRSHLGPLAGEPAMRFDEAGFARKPRATYRIATPPPGETAPEAVIGTTRRYRIRPGDTLLDVARWYDLGYNEIVEANPGVDPMLPAVGTEVVVPTEWVLPCCSYQGIVLNIPEMRLFYYRPDPHDPGTTIVETFPVGLGRLDRRTPRGRYRVASKAVNPTWVIPDSIREEHLRERGDGRRVIAGGAPDNPLGKYRMKLSHVLYSIHGTDVPWGVGMQVTHGCVRLYPEDIEHLFPLVPLGTGVEFTYQPVKIGQRGADVFAEAHRDIYSYSRSLVAAGRAALARQRLDGRVDPALLDGVVQNALGVPTRVSADGVARRRAG
ncbi:MAG TPA: L,D-transpeptidase family protein [Candidatus Binatia bacterium]|nr:L,D-transpeptidase family protein [Candidatus Binatia bacterium]